MNALTIFVDMDDTIEKLLETWVDRVNKKYDQHVVPDMVVTWDVSEAYKNLNKEQVYEVLDDDSIWQDVKPIEGAVEALRYFMDRGHRVYIVTASSYLTLKAKMTDHLFKYFPFISWDQVIVTSNKTLLKGDVMIDDGEHNLLGGDYKKILFTASHNRYFDAEAHGMTRVDTWEEAKTLVDQIAEES